MIEEQQITRQKADRFLEALNEVAEPREKIICWGSYIEAIREENRAAQERAVQVLDGAGI